MFVFLLRAVATWVMETNVNWRTFCAVTFSKSQVHKVAVHHSASVPGKLYSLLRQGTEEGPKKKTKNNITPKRKT